MSKNGNPFVLGYAAIRLRTALQSERDELARTIEEMRAQGCRTAHLELRLAEIDEYLDVTQILE
jgi:hypothetical protein